MAELILRVGVFSTFFSHGILSLQSHPQWLPYLTLLGFSEETAILLMPLIGTVDIILGFIVLFKPNKYLVFWMFLWSLSVTILGSVIDGSILWLGVRSANWIAPLALLYLRRFNR